MNNEPAYGELSAQREPYPGYNIEADEFLALMVEAGKPDDEGELA